MLTFELLNPSHAALSPDENNYLSFVTLQLLSTQADGISQPASLT